jgi:hypothetical protein
LTNSINGMRIAGMVLAIAMCAAATAANAQVQLFVGPGTGNNNRPAPGAAGLGTSGLGLGGFGSSESLGGYGASDASADTGKGLNFGNQERALGMNGGAGGGAAAPSQGSLSSAIDRPSSPMNSVTNSLMGSVGTGASGTTTPAIKPVAKRKPATKAAAASSAGGADVAPKAPAKNP